MDDKSISIDHLINTQDPGWLHVMEWVTAAQKTGELSIEVLPQAPDAVRQVVLGRLQMTTRSTMGALVWESGGLVIDGWLRILGSGSADRRVPSITQFTDDLSLTPAYLGVAYDVLGGVFALSVRTRTVWYFAPDSLQWEDLEVGHTSFVEWALAPHCLSKFYQTHRWSDWRATVMALDGAQGISIFPWLWTEPGLSIEMRSRKVIPIQELFNLNLKKN